MPGTNCELDSAKAFEAAGAETIVRVFRNQNASDIRSSIEQYKEDIKKSQIIMFPVDSPQVMSRMVRLNSSLRYSATRR